MRWAITITVVAVLLLIWQSIPLGDSKPQAPDNSSKLLEDLRFPYLRHHGVTEIRLERGECFGHCPEYEVTLTPDGSIQYQGRRYAVRRGQHTGHVREWHFHRLAQFMIHSGFLEMPELASQLAADSPMTKTSIVVNGKRKEIRNSGNPGPLMLWAIQELIDKTVLDCEWDS